MPDPEKLSTPAPASADTKPVEEFALCLSGGGYRAMLFHLGALIRLNKTGLLKKLGRISSVSGGSITAAVIDVDHQIAVMLEDCGATDVKAGAIVKFIRHPEAESKIVGTPAYISPR